jgi:hypothetical protein
MEVFCKTNLLMFHISKLSNLKIIHDLHSQCLTEILSKTTCFMSMEGVHVSFLSRRNVKCYLRERLGIGRHTRFYKHAHTTLSYEHFRKNVQQIINIVEVTISLLVRTLTLPWKNSTTWILKLSWFHFHHNHTRPDQQSVKYFDWS